MSARKIFGFLALLVYLVTACHSQAPKSKVITDAAHTFQLTVPAGWELKSDLNDQADLQAGSFLASLYVIVIKGDKRDMSGMTLEKHSQTTREFLVEKLSEVDTSEPKHLTIDGKPALQYEIRGVLDNTRIVYLHTTVESSTHFYQIVAWTLPTRWEKDHETLEKVTEYFKELNS